MTDARDESKPDGLGTLPADVLSALEKQSQADFDVEFFDSVLRRSPDYIDVLRCQGELLSRKGMHERAVQVDLRLAKLLPDDPVVLYNLACSLARNDLVDESLATLRRALERGYDDFEYLELDGDFDALRRDPRYQLLIAEFHPARPKRRGKRTPRKS